jgi:sRNA-binding carbon storage regulator CsrA
MLAVSRRRDETVIIKDAQGTVVRVKVLEFKDDGYGQRVILGIAAPREWPVYREELSDNLDVLATLRKTFDDAPENTQRRFLAEVGGHVLARTTHGMLSNLMQSMEKLGLVQLEQRPDGQTVLKSSSSHEEKGQATERTQGE